MSIARLIPGILKQSANNYHCLEQQYLGKQEIQFC